MRKYEYWVNVPWNFRFNVLIVVSIQIVSTNNFLGPGTKLNLVSIIIIFHFWSVSGCLSLPMGHGYKYIYIFPFLSSICGLKLFPCEKH